MTFDQAIALGGVLVALVALVLSLYEHDKNGDKLSEEDAKQQQVLSDKLDGISGMLSETRDDVRELRRLVDNHGRAISAIERDLNSVRGRVKHLEIRIDAVHNNG